MTKIYDNSDEQDLCEFRKDGIVSDDTIHFGGKEYLGMDLNGVRHIVDYTETVVPFHYFLKDGKILEFKEVEKLLKKKMTSKNTKGRKIYKYFGKQGYMLRFLRYHHGIAIAEPSVIKDGKKKLPKLDEMERDEVQIDINEQNKQMKRFRKEAKIQLKVENRIIENSLQEMESKIKEYKNKIGMSVNEINYWSSMLETAEKYLAQ